MKDRKKALPLFYFVCLLMIPFLGQSQALKKSDLKLTNTKRSSFMQNLYVGNSFGISIKKDEVGFLLFLEAYMYAHASNCGGDTEIYVSKCTRKMQKEDRHNNVQDETCLESVMVPTGSFTSAEIYNAYKTSKSYLRNNPIKSALDVIGSVIGDGKKKKASSLSGDVLSNKSDMKKLFAMNSCNSKALKQFEKNLIRFTYGKPLLALDGKVREIRVDYSKEQDFTKLMEDLLIADSKKWQTVYYVRNSVKSIQVEKDSKGIPTRIRSDYTFGLKKQRKKSVVEVKLKNGVPYCIYFPTNPNNKCTRALDRNVMAKLVNGDYSKEDIKKKREEAISSVDTEKVYLIVDKQPTFPEGISSFRKYINENMVYPEKERRFGVQGRIFVSFIVGRDGNVSDVKIARGMGNGLDKEALRLIKEGPKWIPAERKGVPVKFQMKIPIIFKIKR